MLKDTGPLQIILGIVNTIAIILTAIVEEKEMITRFGDAYREYMKETKMFIPFVIWHPPAPQGGFLSPPPGDLGVITLFSQYYKE